MASKGRIKAGERDLIGTCLSSGLSLRNIAQKLDRSVSSVWSEIKRNSINGEYLPISAHRRSCERTSFCQRKRALKSSEIWAYVVDKLRSGWSPEQIAGRLRKHNHGETVICHETIYKYIYSPQGKKENLREYLVRNHRRRYPKHYRKAYRRGIANRVGISFRPKEINTRETFGHWEADVVEGKGHSGGIQTLLERKTRYYQAKLMSKIDSEYGIRAQRRILSRFPEKARQTVTFDNGRENYNHEQLQRDLGVRTYFCDPYSAWQKGANENHNGILRRYIPKKTDLSKLPQWELDLIIEEINNKPRKCLKYQTPKEAFKQELKTVLSSKCSDWL
jgi:IS30 family transposase